MDKMKEETRIFLAFLLSILIIFLFSKYQTSKYKYYQPQQIQTQKKEQPLKIAEEKKIIPEGEKINFETKDYYLELDSKGGYIKEIGLKKFLRKDEKFFPVTEGTMLFSNSEFLNEKEFKFETKENTIFLTNETTDFSISKEYIIPSDDYIFSYKEKIKNNREDKKFDRYSVDIMKIDVKTLTSQRGYIPPKIIVSINKLPVFLDPHRIKEEKIYKNCRYLGLNLRYSLIFVYLPENSTVSITPENGYISANLVYENFVFKSGEEKEFNFKFYAGPSDYFVAREKIKEDIFGKGFFTVIGRFLFSVLNGIHKVIPNWGWAIIILTFIIKILFFPLTRKSLKSMNQLQKLRPYLQDIQKKYKDNPHQLQKELMNIYKEYNINPFAGCLPTIIQIPIFIGFFLALRNSVFLRGAPFILWIKDLSMPDTVFKINGFPLNILPVLMTITSYFQQKLTPTTDPSQKSLTVIMPLMFLFILYNFPSGLLLYWVTMNIASLIEQLFISNKILLFKK